MINELNIKIKKFKTIISFVIVLSKKFYYKNEKEMIKLIRENKDIDFLITDFNIGKNEVIFIEKGQFYLNNIIYKLNEEGDE